MSVTICEHGLLQDACLFCHSNETSGGRAVARLSDPYTSHEAAASVTDLTEKQKAVLSVLRELGGRATDQKIRAAYLMSDHPYQSDSGLRTRRAELVEQGKVRDSREWQRLPSGRKAIVWEVV